MHDHLFYELEPSSGTVSVPAQATFARLYLAAGVTTIRTTGTVDFDGDKRLKQLVDSGSEPGPRIHLTSPYLEGAVGEPDPQRTARQVLAYADRGATSVKAYTSLRSAELKAAIEAAHSRGLTVTGHLCAVGFMEAAALGIDNVEHGFAFDSELDPKRTRDECPPQWDVFSAMSHLNSADAQIRSTIEQLVRRHVAMTSTLAVIESFAVDESLLDLRVRTLLAPRLRDAFERALRRHQDARESGRSWWSAALTNEMRLERAFVDAGGTLLAGSDPTGWGAIVAGSGDQRGLELLVSAGFSPEEVVKIATLNGARFLRDETVGSIEPGKRADLVVVRGDPATRIYDVRNVELVFKQGIAYDPEDLSETTAGTLGAFSLRRLTRYWPVLAVLLAFVVFREAVKGIRRSRRGKEWLAYRESST
jgi:imidazolonepropionase-like amidohydrolase